MAAKAILLMAYGSAKDLADLERYYTHIRRGRAPSQAELEDLTRRYQAIGGHSPLLEITRRQALGLEQALSRRPGFEQIRVYMGMKHSPPFIAETVQRMVADGVDEIYAMVLAPHFSTMSVGQYIQEAVESLADAKAEVRWIPVWSWHLAPGLIDLFVGRVREGLARFGPEESVTVLITAHSLPERILQVNDPYPDQIQATGHAVMAAFGGKIAYEFGWQSAGRTREPWLGPDLLIRLEQLAQEGKRAILVCPVGFVSDHLEILYDLDVKAQRVAEGLGIHLERTRSLNDDPGFFETLAEVIAGTVSEQVAEAT